MQRAAAVFTAVMLASMTGTARADEFPDGATKPSADEIKQYVEGKVFNIQMDTGDVLRAEYKNDGTLDWSVKAKGWSRSVLWSHSDGTLCDQQRGKPKSCNDVRMVGGVLYLKRENGAILQYTP